MPLIEIHMLRSSAAGELDRVGQSINAEVTAALDVWPDAVWTTWRTLAGYAVGRDHRSRARGASEC
jgi:hypothetical protein